jgi:outer membrane immunogenic protein
MKKLLFGSVAVVALIAANAASAADVAIKAAPRALVPVTPTWTGCYINGGAGYGFFRQEQHAFSSVVVLADETAGGSGWLGKVGGGCDYQFSPASGWGNWVVGAFADYDFMDLRGHLGVIGGALVGSEKESSAAAAGGRIGYLLTPQILTYVNGGWSSTRFDGVTFESRPARRRASLCRDTRSMVDLSAAAPRWRWRRCRDCTGAASIVTPVMDRPILRSPAR